MFTGIVTATGRIVSSEPQRDGRRIVVDASALDVRDVKVGDSIALSGCCLTVVAAEDRMLHFDVSAATLRCTTGLDGAGDVNLEKALRLADRLGGHLMTGHVDGVGDVAAFDETSAGGDRTLEIDAPKELARFIAVKGSVAVQGVSLTVNAIAGTRFCVNLIPHTLAVTTLRRLEPGARVNLEVDLIARYVARMHDADESSER